MGQPIQVSHIDEEGEKNAINQCNFKVKNDTQSDIFLPSFKKIPELHICEFCLHATCEKAELYEYHMPHCSLRYPPGNEIYRDTQQKILVFEIDGINQPYYCERLCLLARLFLDHKCVKWDVSPFLFYVLTFYDKFGAHITGYFAKEKKTIENCNLSCILVLPPYQGRGLGRFLIEFSYALTKREGKVGTPERPLSDLGWRSYHSYWRDILLDHLLLLYNNDKFELPLSILSTETGITTKDIVDTLRCCGIMDRKKNTKIHLPENVKHDHYQRKALRISNGGPRFFFESCLLAWNPEDFILREISEKQYLDFRLADPNSENIVYT